MSKILNYLKNPNLKAVGVQIQFTEDQIQEYIKCTKDPIYFIENYCKIVSLDKGIINMKLFPYQKRMVDAIHNNKNTIGKIGRQLGKCVHGDTVIRLRNKKTDEIVEITIEEFFKMTENKFS